ncbi:MAG: hypothetical protein GXO07_01790 [Crenarchaeota archaeon]|nr:hypothetical protein [Thermoproteota archaeon]
MRRRELLRDLAKQRFYGLVEMAFEEARRGRWELAALLGEQAFRIAKKGGYRVPRSVKRKFCRKCGIPLIPGVTARVRIRNKGVPTVVVTCLNCHYVRRYPGKHEGLERPAEPDAGDSSHREEGRHGGSGQRNKEAA